MNITIYQWHQKKSERLEQMLSPYQLEIKNKYNIKVGATNKLIPNLYPKKNYVCSL